jgi:hypothetical protein
VRENRSKRWTAEEDRQVRESRAAGLHAKEIAQALGRTVAAVRLRVKALECEWENVGHCVTCRLTSKQFAALEAARLPGELRSATMRRLLAVVLP